MVVAMSLSGYVDKCNLISVDDTADVSGCVFNVRGKNNKVFFGPGCVMKSSRIEILSDNNAIYISENCNISANVIMKLSDGNELFIGKNTSCGGANIICGESTSIKIGEDCMLAWGIEIRSTDSHGIYDKITAERVNKAENIEIKDHVWVGAQVVILSGAHINQGSVVGIRSVVSKYFPEEAAVLVGVPARVVRLGVTWERQLLG